MNYKDLAETLIKDNKFKLLLVESINNKYPKNKNNIYMHLDDVFNFDNLKDAIISELTENTQIVNYISETVGSCVHFDQCKCELCDENNISIIGGRSREISNKEELKRVKSKLINIRSKIKQLKIKINYELKREQYLQKN